MPDRLPQSFYRQPAAELAQQLIGKILVHRFKGKSYRSRIVETGAYVGPEDLACHASKGLTQRTKILFGPPGRAYVYFIYGMYDMLNIVAKQAGHGHAVLIRAAEPLGWDADLSGPGKLTRDMHITRALNGLSLAGNQLFLLDSPDDRPELIITPRIGIDYAKHWKDAPLRFYDANSRAVSKRAVQVNLKDSSPAR